MIFALASLPLLGAQVHAAEPAIARREQRVRDVIKRWSAAYRTLNAAALAALETTEVEIVDRFGESHLLRGESEKEQYWVEGFEMIARNQFAPEARIQRVRLIRVGVAMVEVCTRYPAGIELVDGSRIPMLWETTSYLVVNTGGSWLVAAMNIHDQVPPEKCSTNSGLRDPH